MSKLAVVSIFLAAGLAGGQSIMQEPNLEKRSQLAMQQANTEFDAAKKAYSDSQLEPFKTHVAEVASMAELSYRSLLDTGKKARRSPKWFKRTEQAMRALLRKLDGLEKDVSIEDRAPVGAARKRVADVHEQLLHDIMTKK